ncbi:hypothetical protein CHS0354_039539 [Potamilus streckersoni]|uniref:Indoleamine 2,3-dioxygenase n=1 Tax=Potamilus streckersoni TaxID=2493646 RepID=A0AAE0TLW3_9BIVA|nr:hypothetical protein CHS0354_039539 [Potamilus streckersoni]
MEEGVENPAKDIMDTEGLLSINLSDFHVSQRVGFLLEKPLAELPAYFEPWNQVCSRMPELVMQHRLRQEVDKMDVLDHHKLQGYRQLRLAHLQLSFISAGYIWQDGDKGVPEKLPRCLAVPWCGLSKTLGIQPVLSHSDLVLANWTTVDPDSPLALENLRCFYTLPGGGEADWFITVTVQMELDFAAALKPVVSALKYAENSNAEKLKICLTQITDVVRKMKNSLERMHDNLSADTFYNTLRPFLTGWGGEGSPLPEGLVYEGVSDTPIQMNGGSAAQSSTLQTLDATLGIVHSEDKQDFLKKMRMYMPPDHRHFIETLEQRSKIKDFVKSCSCQALTAAYNDCVTAVVVFRSYHIQIVTKATSVNLRTVPQAGKLEHTSQSST